MFSRVGLKLVVTGPSQEDVITAYETLIEARDLYISDREIDLMHDRAVALKASIEQFGMTPSLMAFANYNGSLSEAMEMPEISLESMSETDVQACGVNLVAALESFIEDTSVETASTEGFEEWFHVHKNRLSAAAVVIGSLAAVVSGPLAIVYGLGLAGNIYLIDRLVNKGKVYGRFSDAEQCLSNMKLKAELLRKIMSIGVPAKGASREEFLSKWKTISPMLEKVGIVLKEAGSGYDHHDVTKRSIKLVNFSTSGFTPDNYKQLVHTFKDDVALVREEVDNANDYVEDLINTKTEEVVFTHDVWCTKLVYNVTFEIAYEATRDARELGNIMKSASRFFTKEKPADKPA